MNIGLIVAAGKGTRIKSINIPKQFISINKKPLIVYTLETFQQHNLIDKIIIVTNSEYLNEMQDICDKYSLSKVCYIVQGGNTRKESVFNGLLKLKELGVNKDDIVLIHDGARALVSDDIITNNIEECIKNNACTTAIKLTDTAIKSLDKKTIETYLNRDEIFLIQTPQTFKFDLILKAHENELVDNNLITDDTSLVLNLNHNVSLVEGSRMNFKVTTDDDLEFFKKIVK